jgi:hypothetical protein
MATNDTRESITEFTRVVTAAAFIEGNQMAFSDNLLRAQAAAEALRPQSIKTIEASTKLLQHAEIIERTGNLFQHFGHSGPFRDDDDVVIRVLGHRAFNDLMVAANLILSGYYQSGVILARDLLEVTFLLHDFSAERGNIEKWRTLRDKSHDELFKPVVIRKRLDDRDGFTSKKRAEAYKFMSSLAGHPSPTGFQMLLSGGVYRSGPFFDSGALESCWSELAKVTVQVGMHYATFFKPDTRAAAHIKAEYLDVTNAWLETFFGQPRTVSVEQIAEMHALADRLPN